MNRWNTRLQPVQLLLQVSRLLVTESCADAPDIDEVGAFQAGEQKAPDRTRHGLRRLMADDRDV
jgi:hypothetical protein